MKLLKKQPHTSESEHKVVVVGLQLDTDSTEFSGAKASLTEMKLRYVLHCSASQNNHKGRAAIWKSPVLLRMRSCVSVGTQLLQKHSADRA